VRDTVGRKLAAYASANMEAKVIAIQLQLSVSRRITASVEAQK
jgi:hypothetical protein